MTRKSNYDKLPFVEVGSAAECVVGWNAIAAHLAPRTVIAVECYPGVQTKQLIEHMCSRLPGHAVFSSEDCIKSPQQLRLILDPLLGTDRVFGKMSEITLHDYFDASRVDKMRLAIERAAAQGPVLVIGSGASLVAPKEATLVYADIARWEIQLRFRRGEIGNLGLHNAGENFAALYKCGFFVEWRAADRLKKILLPKVDFLLDSNDMQQPKMIPGEAFRRALHGTAYRPFRIVPYFDPGPWGGHWLEVVCDLPRDVPNYAWGFDCVPEENSLLLGFGDRRVEVPAIDLVYQEPQAVLGESVYRRFGAEFPIRFDFLDTMGGGNLSLQVHPLTAYIRQVFGMQYTQDESYYLLEAGADANVFLGLKEGISCREMIEDLERAKVGEEAFPVDSYVNRWRARKHDHFLIPAGTVHCSGANSMVLEISATPYIFTFKLWDWERLGLDGRPRPIHVEHGVANIQWDWTTDWVEKNLINRFEDVSRGQGWREERTGLHPQEFIETRRHWFKGTVPHHTGGNLNVLCLVEGDEAIVESPDGAFEPFPIHYAETFIVPAAVGPYTIRPSSNLSNKELATIKAFVRG